MESSCVFTITRTSPPHKVPWPMLGAMAKGLTKGKALESLELQGEWVVVPFAARRVGSGGGSAVMGGK